MERSGETITHTQAEQERFDVPPVVSVDQAVEVASAFDVVAHIIERRMQAPTEEDLDGGPVKRGDDVKKAKLERRASELRGYSRDIFRLCAPEVAERAISDFQLPR